MKGDGTDVMSPERPSRWRSGLMVMVLVTVTVVLVIISMMLVISPTDPVSGNTNYVLIDQFTIFMLTITAASNVPRKHLPKRCQVRLAMHPAAGEVEP